MSSDEDTVSTCRSLQFSTYISPSAAVSNILDLTQSSASHFSEKEEANLGGRYNRLTGGYCSRKLPNRKRCLQRRLWFATDVMVSTIKWCTIVDMFIITVLGCIVTHSSVSLDMFVVCIIRSNDDFPG